MLVIRKFHKLTELLFLVKTPKTVGKVCSKLAKSRLLIDRSRRLHIFFKIGVSRKTRAMESFFDIKKRV